MREVRGGEIGSERLSQLYLPATSEVTKRVFRAAPGRTLALCPPPQLGTRRARVRTRRYLWTVPRIPRDLESRSTT
eukprot:scaffold48450_cov39-Phaeocystis_antarctica.AAC.3